MVNVSDGIKQKENESIMKHLQAIKKIVAKKCKRCDYPYGCLGCIFSSGELMHDIDHGIELMERLCMARKEDE